MANDDTRRHAPPPRLSSLRVPADPTLPGLARIAHVLWRLSAQRRQAVQMASGNPGEEYKSVCEFMRLYATLRFYQLALLLGTTSSIVTALSSNAVRANLVRAELLKAGGLVVCLAFLVMELRASSYWHALRGRANHLAQALQFEGFPTNSRWNPLTTSGAGLYLHVLIATLWLASLFFSLNPSN